MEDLEIKFDSKKVKNFIKKYHLFLLVLIPLFFSIYFRAYTYDLPITDNMARSTIESSLRTQIQNEILSQTNNIDQNTLDTLTEQRYQSYINTNKAALDQQTIELSNQIKQYYKDDSGQTYLLAIDPYFYLRQAENVLENGHVGDELKDGKPFDNHMTAPKGRILANNFHPFIGAIFHKISSIFGNDLIMKTMFILPLIFASLSVIPAFFITRKVAGNLGGLVAAFIVGVHPSFLGRTPAGFSDTDAYSIFFPLLIIWLFLEAFTTQNNRNRYLFGGLAGLTTGVFAFAWGGWWYIFDILMGSLVVYFLYLAVKYRKNVFKKLKTKNLLILTVTYVISSILFVTLFTNFREFLSTVRSPLGVILIREATFTSLWPNVYTTVAELNVVSFSQIINILNGRLFFMLSIVGILLVFLKRDKIQKDIKYGIIMVLWFTATLYSATKGVRFVMFVIPIFAVGIGIFYGKIFRYINEWAPKGIGVNKKLIASVLIILAVITFIPLTKAAHENALREVPSMNDAWYNSLTKIKLETPEDAIVNSWWDFGHWFKAIADRRVTFDGASQNTPPAHWVGKVLLTNNEDEAIGILRMLDCGSNDAFDLLLEETNDRILTKKVIDDVTLKDKDSARITLSEYTDNPDIILEKTHCDPPENYFITSEDMISKSGVWAHFGNWDFERAFAYNTIKSNNKEKSISLIEERTDFTREEADTFYAQLEGATEQEANNWISPFGGISSFGNCQELNQSIFCTNGVVINENNQAFVNSEGRQIPIKYYRDNKNIYINEQGISDFAVAYVPSLSRSFLIHPNLVDSMFIELYFYNGENLRNFELFSHERGIDGFDIYIWKVKWTSQ